VRLSFLEGLTKPSMNGQAHGETVVAFFELEASIPTRIEVIVSSAGPHQLGVSLSAAVTVIQYNVKPDQVAAPWSGTPGWPAEAQEHTRIRLP